MPKKGKSVLVTKKDVAKMIDNALDEAVDDKVVRYFYASNVGTAGVILPANFLKKGTEQFQRIGTKIQNKAVHVRGQLRGDSVACVMRCIIGFYKSVPQVGGVGTLPSVTDILRTENSAGTATTGYRSEYNPENRANFIIYSDRTYSLSGFAGISRLAAGTPNQTADSYTQSKFVILDERHRIPHKTTYVPGSDTGLIADVFEGLPFMLLISDNNTNLPTYEVTLNSFYEDA